MAGALGNHNFESAMLWLWGPARLREATLLSLLPILNIDSFIRLAGEAQLTSLTQDTTRRLTSIKPMYH